MEKESGAGTAWLTAAAWASLLMFAIALSVLSVSLTQIGDELEVGFGLLGALATPRSCAIALAALSFGYAADRIGKKWLLVVGMLVLSLALFWAGRTETYLGLMGGMFLVGAGLGVLEALVSPLVAELHPHSVATHMNVLHGFFPIGLVGSSLLVGHALDAGVPWRTPFVLAAVPAVAVGAMFAVGKYPNRRVSERPAPLRAEELLSNGTFWLLAVAMALTAGAEGAFIHWGPSFVQTQYGVDAQTGGYGLMAFSAAMAVGRFGAGAAVRRVSLTGMMIAMALLSAAAALCVAALPSLPVTLIALALAGLFGACFWPTILALASERIAAGSATLFAVMAAAGIGGVAIVPLAVGALAERFDLRIGLGALSLCFLGAALVLVPLARRPAGPRSAYPGT